MTCSQVVRATEVAEEELKNLANELCGAVADIDQQVASKEQQLVRRTKVVQTSNDQVPMEDNQL
jgi:hypothetical protein